MCVKTLMEMFQGSWFFSYKSVQIHIALSSVFWYVMVLIPNVLNIIYSGKPMINWVQGAPGNKGQRRTKEAQYNHRHIVTNFRHFLQDSMADMCQNFHQNKSWQALPATVHCHCQPGCLPVADGHTMSNAPDLFWPPKLSGIGPG